MIRACHCERSPSMEGQLQWTDEIASSLPLLAMTARRVYSTCVSKQPHICLPGSDTNFTIWRGSLASKLLKQPLLLDAELVRKLQLTDQLGKPWDFRRAGLSELRVVSMHTRATRLFTTEQVMVLLRKTEAQ